MGSPIDVIMMTIRPAAIADAPAIARIHVKSWRVTYAGLLPRAYLDGLSAADREARWTRHLAETLSDASPLFVAVDQHQVIGFVNTGPAQKLIPGHPRELYVIHVLRAYQRRGVGKLLMAAAIDAERELGTASLMLWCFTDNLPARRFYEKLGGVVIGEKQDEFGGISFSLVAYGWPDLALLSDALSPAGYTSPDETS